MATVREGNKAVLLVVDVQVGVMSKSWDALRVIKNVSRAVERARRPEAKGSSSLYDCLRQDEEGIVLTYLENFRCENISFRSSRLYRISVWGS